MNDSKKTLLPALFAMGTGLAVQPAAAIELGEINVQSTLGQPLRASIAYALGPNEQLANYCVTLKPGLSNGGLPAITSANISVANGIILLTGRFVVREPLMSLRLDVACPYTPNLSREYMLFIDPAAPIRAAVAAQPAAQPAAAAEPAPATAVTRPAAQPTPQPAVRPAARRAPASRAPIDAAATYRVQPGDSLSQIAERIENRPVGLWQAVGQIFEANPDAFIDNDPNKLKAGSLLVMPDFAVRDAAPTFAAKPAVETRTPAPVEATPAPQVEPIEPVPLAEVDDTAVLEPAIPAGETLEPGDVVLDVENPFVGSAEPEIGLPDTELEATTPASSPNVPVATIVQPERSEPASTNWLLWLVGGGIALIVGLLMFGRRGRDLGDPEAVATAASHPMRRSSDSAEVEALPEDDDPTEENLALDADLAIGSGLSAGTEVEVDHDFGYESGDTKLDLEFPLEDEAAKLRSTDALPAPKREEDLVVDEEVLPDNTDYDMSVIMDATQVPDHEAVTERDLRAVEVDADSDDDTAGYTVNQEIDYQILEQDYEDELTATQALNKEIEKAAAELAERLGGNAGDGDKTADLKLATVTALDVGARRDEDDDISDLDDTGVNEELTAEMPGDEQTVEMPPGGDDTVEIPKKSKKA